MSIYFLRSVCLTTERTPTEKRRLLSRLSATGWRRTADFRTRFKPFKRGNHFLAFVGRRAHRDGVIFTFSVYYSLFWRRNNFFCLHRRRLDSLCIRRTERDRLCTCTVLRYRGWDKRTVRIRLRWVDTLQTR